jgi:hypothetical protein
MAPNDVTNGDLIVMRIPQCRGRGSPFLFDRGFDVFPHAETVQQGSQVA